MPRIRRFAITLAALAAIAASPLPSQAQTKVKTETIELPPLKEETETPAEPEAGVATGPAETAPLPIIQYDPQMLPAPVRRMREQLMEAAAAGDLEAMRPMIEVNELPPLVSFGDETDPIAFWRTAGGDPEGREILAILIEILEAGFVHLDQGTPQEMYVWPYFYALPLNALTPAQEVELYKLITSHDRVLMEEFGAYNFYRLGLGPDGTWHFFVAGD